MNDYHAARFTALRLTNDVLHAPEHASPIASNLAVTDEVTWLDGKVDVIDALVQRANRPREGITADKVRITDLLVALTLRLAQPTAAYAVVRGNAILEGKTAFSESALRELKDAAMDDRAQLVHDEIALIHTAETGIASGATPRPLRAFGVTPEQNAELANLILAYGAVVDNPAQAIVQQKTLNEAILAELDTTSARLTRILDRLMIIFKNNGTTLYGDYFNARLIRETGGGSGPGGPAPGGTTPPTAP